MPWSLVYDPLGHVWLSTLFAALPVVVLLGALAVFKIKAHTASLLGLATSILVAVLVFGMPVKMAAGSLCDGAAYGLFPIGWIILNVIFLYQLTKERGLFDVLRQSITGITQDSGLQLLLVAFSFGAFFEGASGFGTPVAVTGALLIGLGFSPLSASGLSLIANTAPVAYGALGTPLIGLQSVTGLDLKELSAMVGRQLPFFSVIVPFWVVWAYAGWRGMLGVWPAALTAGVAFAIPQYLVSNFHGPWLTDIVGSLVSLGALVLLLKVWRPKENPPSAHNSPGTQARVPHVFKAWVPWILLSVLVFAWGVPQMKKALDAISAPKFPVSHLHEIVLRVPPVVAKPTAEKAVYSFNWLSATGSGILVAAILAGFAMRFSAGQLVKTYWETLV